MAPREISQEVNRRRTFAIISHPDAGKTTLTEKLLLFAGAIHIAGSVKARKAARHATSDWMEIEKQRGISVASSVMQMEYRDCVINLLDTPGHQDFSEDTYRVLTAVDAALMVIDAANGMEAQTLRLLEVCRAAATPIITFINKMDREVREPLDADGRDRAHAGDAGGAVHLAGGHGQALQRRVRPARATACACSGPARTASAARTRSSRASTTRRAQRALRRCLRAGARRRSSSCRACRPPSTARRFSRAGRRRCSSARPSTISASGKCSTRSWSLAPPPRPRKAHRSASSIRWSRSSPASSSRSRPTWTRGTATASRSCACARAISSAACASRTAAPARSSAPTAWCRSCRSGASWSTRPTRATSSAFPTTACCSWATR